MTDVLLVVVICLLVCVCGWLAVITHHLMGLRPAREPKPGSADALTRPDLLAVRMAPPEPYEPTALGRHHPKPTPHPRVPVTESGPR